MMCYSIEMPYPIGARVQFIVPGVEGGGVQSGRVTAVIPDLNPPEYTVRLTASAAANAPNLNLGNAEAYVTIRENNILGNLDIAINNINFNASISNNDSIGESNNSNTTMNGYNTNGSLRRRRNTRRRTSNRRRRNTRRRA